MLLIAGNSDFTIIITTLLITVRMRDGICTILHDSPQQISLLNDKLNVITSSWSFAIIPQGALIITHHSRPCNYVRHPAISP